MVATVADWLLDPVMSLSLVAPNLWIHYPPPSFVTIPIIITRLSNTLLSSLSFILHLHLNLQSSSISLGTGKGWVLLFQTSPSPKFIHFPCSFQNGWVYSSKHLHLQSSSIYPGVSKMGGFIHPSKHLHLQISSIYPAVSKMGGFIHPSKHLHLQSSSIYPAVSKMGGFIHPNIHLQNTNIFISISISRVHPLP